tara:strand:- start:6663 stop:7007 length:345 start_codon:yes stop_codon:yes gene_type:complete
MNSAEMEYNLSRHPDLYYMDEDGLIRLNEEEYEKQTEMKTMIPTLTTGKRDMIIRAKNGKVSPDTEKDKKSKLDSIQARYPNVQIYLESDWESIDVADMVAAENEHTNYVLTQI